MTAGRFPLTRARANDPAEWLGAIRPARCPAFEQLSDRGGRTCAPSFHSAPSLCRACRKGDAARKTVTTTNPAMAIHNVG